LLKAYILEFRGNWEDHLLLVEFIYNNIYQAIIETAPYEALYGRRYWTSMCWEEVGDRQLIGSKLVQITLEKIKIIKNRMKAA